MTSDVFDREGVLKALSGDESLLGELVSVYVASLDERLGSIERSLSGEDGVDFVAITYVAHNLVGSSGTVGASAVGTTAKALDTAARAGDEASARETFARLKADIADYLKAIDSAL